MSLSVVKGMVLPLRRLLDGGILAREITLLLYCKYVLINHSIELCIISFNDSVTLMYEKCYTNKV